MDVRDRLIPLCGDCALKRESAHGRTGSAHPTTLNERSVNFRTEGTVSVSRHLLRRAPFVGSSDSPMPIDYNFEHTPNFRDVTRTSLLLLQRPLVRSLAKLRRLRKGQPVCEVPTVRTDKPFAGVR